MDVQAAAAVTRRHLAERGHEVDALEPLAGDVSRRRYFRARLSRGGGAIVAVYPEDLREVCRRFARTAELLSEVGVAVPEIYDADCDAGWMLLEDAGPATLFDLHSERTDPWGDLRTAYREATGILERISSIDRGAVAALNPPLDGVLLRRELDQTWEAFLEPRGHDRERGFGKDLGEALEALCAALAREPALPCHRDFMVRNLIPRPPELVVLDHQDLRLGPRFYDLASLLNDSLFPPQTFVERLLDGASWSSQERLGYHRAAAQRTLKAVGTFARHGSPKHAALIGPTLVRACDHLGGLPEAANLAPDLGPGGRLLRGHPGFETEPEGIC